MFDQKENEIFWVLYKWKILKINTEKETPIEAAVKGNFSRLSTETL